MKPALRTFCFLVGCAVPAHAQESRPAQLREVSVAGQRIVHVHGAPRARSEAFGRAYAAEIVTLVRAEYAQRFARREGTLESLRQRLPKLIAFEGEIAEEITGLWDGIVAAGVERTLPDLERELDRRDLELVNALDVFGLMACSGFTAASDQVEGGGVLTTRNFDWPYTGAHLVANTIVMVVHPEQGSAHAFVTWPGYFGAVTGVSERGVAVFLHVGSGAITFQPRPRMQPTAIAARAILRDATPADAETVARRELGRTSPPASYLTRVVLPTAAAGAGPELVFETDARSVELRHDGTPCVTTNHFLARTDGRDASGDSLTRRKKIGDRLAAHLRDDDRRISVAEAWGVLAAVQRGGLGYGTLHSLVYRHEPWCFELALGVPVRAREVRPAPSAGAKVAIPRELLFAVPPEAPRR